jgi:AcrR family transcriptional regulator
MSKKDRLEKVARHVLTREGLSGFTMERLAEAAEVSRPTVYQYFGSREGALAATALSTIAVCSKLFESAQRFQGAPREQAMALMTGFEVLARFEPDHLETLEFLGMPWIKRALPSPPLEALQALVSGFGTRLKGLMQLSVEQGQLALPLGYPMAAAAFHTQNFYYGIFFAVARRRISYDLYGGNSPWEASRRGLHVYWDGIGWSPKAGDSDMEALHDRILRQCFPDYWLRLKTDELKRGLDTPPTEPIYRPIPEPRSRARALKPS